MLAISVNRLPLRLGPAAARLAALVAALSLAAPSIAQGATAVIVPPPPPAPAPSAPAYPYPVYPLPGWVHPDGMRCEQDRLLTDRTPCGAQTEAQQLPPCQQDRLLTDRTPCTKP
ncbi:hypothetical protein HZF05_12775 [Sphingomonas sp. CGMCC 1.13654]|uniref:Uncharacterized protein n=1 Tax=Sphingomonas chungangi TaxID=2683589 RepID=A0A838L660_9SPHN|nr:hypothetical protein [Sphingomonas chungangi]MBA2934973.1 hypothetical protein [Sphingomonas chungangi]MVW58283.1 hypothetical protein [Sphingomonas chungangi]